VRGCLQEEIDERLLRLGRESRESSIQGGREAVSGGVVGVAERSGCTEATARHARRGGGAAAVKRRGGQAPQWPAAGAALARRAARLGDGTARARADLR